MSKLLTDKFFWTIPPSSILIAQDKLLGYIFLGIIIVAAFFRILMFLTKNMVQRNLLAKFWRMFLTIGIVGIIWYVLRYENTPIFALRLWAGLDLLAGVIWLLFILKFLVFEFPKQRTEHEKIMLRNKYLPGNK